MKSQFAFIVTIENILLFSVNGFNPLFTLDANTTLVTFDICQNNYSENVLIKENNCKQILDKV